MASSAANPVVSTDNIESDPTDIPQALARQIQPLQSSPPLSTPVEMSRFDAKTLLEDIPPEFSPSSATMASDTLRSSRDGEGRTTESVSSSKLQSQNLLANVPNPPAGSGVTPPNPIIREKTAPAIGPSSDKPTVVPKDSEITGPILMITLLLTNGARHPYKIDEKYLKKRNVIVEDNNPINMSTYTLKELIWREWREEWEARPSSPSSIRLIYYGKLLDDKMRLQDCKFVIGPTTHVVHMTIKPQEIVDEEDAKTAKSGSRDRDGNERVPGCRCVIL